MRALTTVQLVTKTHEMHGIEVSTPFGRGAPAGSARSSSFLKAYMTAVHHPQYGNRSVPSRSRLTLIIPLTTDLSVSSLVPNLSILVWSRRFVGTEMIDWCRRPRSRAMSGWTVAVL